MITHGRSKTSEYRIWASMKRRCTKSSASDFARYGGRGISICESWKTFDGFFADMGARPSRQHSLDRIDNEVGYRPDNCRWALPLQQANNKRTTHFVEYRGTKVSIAEAARIGGSGVRRETAVCRIKNGWDVADAVERPPLFRRDASGRKIWE